MKAVLQRVSYGKVSVEGETVASISHGLLILLGVAPEDTLAKAEELAEKCARLRIFEDDQAKMNLSLLDVGGEALVVSQFTLFADTSRGRRPSFINAGRPEIAEALVSSFVHSLKKLGIAAQEGIFGAHMMVELCNDGPVTILLEV